MLLASRSFSVISRIAFHESNPAATKRARYWDMSSQDSVSSKSAMIRFSKVPNQASVTRKGWARVDPTLRKQPYAKIALSLPDSNERSLGKWDDL